MMETPTTFAERLRLAMTRSGIKNAELSRRVGLTHPTISALLSGRNKGTKKVAAIADVLGVDPHWLADGTEPKNPVAETGQLNRALMERILVNVIQFMRDDTSLTPSQAANMVFKMHDMWARIDEDTPEKPE